MIVKNVNNLIKVPDTLSLEIAALLPCGALRAFAAVQRAKPFVQAKMNTAGKTRPIHRTQITIISYLECIHIYHYV